MEYIDTPQYTDPWADVQQPKTNAPKSAPPQATPQGGKTTVPLKQQSIYPKSGGYTPVVPQYQTPQYAPGVYLGDYTPKPFLMPGGGPGTPNIPSSLNPSYQPGPQIWGTKTPPSTWNAGAQPIAAVPIRGAGAAAVVGAIGQIVMQPNFFQNPGQGFKNMLPEWAGGPKYTDPWQQGKNDLEKWKGRISKGIGGGKSPNGQKESPYKNPSNPTKDSPQNGPQPDMSSPNAPPSGGPGGEPKNPTGTKSPNPGAKPSNPILPFFPWEPDFKWPRMPWDPETPKKPDDPKKPGKPGNPGKPDDTKPKPDGKVPQGVAGFWFISFSTGIFNGITPPPIIHPGYSTDKISVSFQNLGKSPLAGDGFKDIDRILKTVGIGGAIYSGETFYGQPNTPSFRLKPENQPDPGLAPRNDPGNSKPREPEPRIDPGKPGFDPQNPNKQPDKGDIPRNNGFFPGGTPNGSFLPGGGGKPDRIPPRNNGLPERKDELPRQDRESGPGRLPYTREIPRLDPAPSGNPNGNQPQTNQPRPWTNPFFTPNGGTGGNGGQIFSPETNPGKLTGETRTGNEVNTGDQTGRSRINKETIKYEPTNQADRDRFRSDKPYTSNPSETIGSTPKTSAQIPSNQIPFIPVVGAPASTQIPKGQIPQPITNPAQTPATIPASSPAALCRYVPDATVTVGLAKYEPISGTITYVPTVVSASNAAGFQHLAQETANMRKEVSGIHKVLEVDLYRSPTGKVVAPKAECEVLQAVMSVSPLAAVPLIKTLPQEMKVLAAMNHMYSGHHLLGRVQLPNNPMDAKAGTVAPLTTVGMMLSMYSNTIATVGIPNTQLSVNDKGTSIATPFRNSIDGIETTNAHVQGLQTEMSGVMEMLFKVLQNQELAINMIHKETFKTDVLIKDTGCRTTEMAVKRPSVLLHHTKQKSLARFEWRTLFQGSTVYTNVPIWKGDLDKQQLGLKTNIEAQKANTSVYFPISGKGDSALPKLSKKSKKDKEWERYVKTINDSKEKSVYHGPGIPESKIEEIKDGIVKKIVTDSVNFVGEKKT